MEGLETMDWILNFQPAAIAMFYGQSPYVHGFYNAPWTLLPLMPIAFLPARIGQICIFVLGLLTFGYIAYRLKSSPFVFVLFLTSMPVISCLFNGGIDWLVMLSFVLPAPFALILAVTKPQIGIGIVVYWFLESWRVGGYKEVIRNFTPVSLLFAASFWLYGFWFLSYSDRLDTPYNFSIFPYLVPIGLYLLYSQRKNAAMAAGVCVAPYFTPGAIVTLMVALVNSPILFIVAWVASWTIGILPLLIAM